MQNKPNFQNDRFNLKHSKKKAYENFCVCGVPKNKPKTNPIKPNFQKAKMDVNLYVIEDYENVPLRRHGKIKPNFQKAKMNVNSLTTKDYRKKRRFRSPTFPLMPPTEALNCANAICKLVFS